MLVSEASIATDKAARYMGQLCKHFEHKLPVTFDREHGRIEFAVGVCHLTAGESTLSLQVEAADEERLTRMEGVVASHLERFAFREPLQIAWDRTRASATEPAGAPS